MSTRFIDNESVICADFLNEVDDILIALCNASTKQEIQSCLDMLTSSQLAQTYLALDGSNRMTAQLPLQGDVPVEDFHATTKNYVDTQIASVSSSVGFTRHDEAQVAHGFTVGQAIFWNGATWELAVAAGFSTAGTHIVVFISDADNFQIAQSGYVENLPASTLTPGAVHYVSATIPGGLTVTEPPFSNPIIIGITDTVGWVLNQRAVASSGLDFASQTDINNSVNGVAIDPQLANANYLVKSATGQNGDDQTVLLPTTFNSIKDTTFDGATNTILTRTSLVASEVPTDLEQGELQLNIPDAIVYFGDEVGGIIPFKSSPTPVHNDTTGRDAAGAHPISSITNLQTELDNRYTKAEVDAMWPVGAIYLSLGAGDPNTFLPGTWEVTAEGSFLIGTGTLNTDTYAAGDTGGEVTHQLTINELPSHSHGLNRLQDVPVGGGNQRITGAGATVNTNITGGNQPHENRPPYLAVNIWTRTI